MDVAARSELGHIRERNEDALIVREQGGSCLMGVADGMGGHPAGDVASATAVRAIEAALSLPLQIPETELVAALRIAHEAVLAAAADEPAYAGMGTTAALTYVDARGATVAHVGDSRVYHVREGAATLLTHDHNRFGYLTQALGVPYRIDPDTRTTALAPGDRLLLCTDGLSGLLPADTIGTLAATGAVTAACDRLVDAALAAGGHDNVTVVLLAL